MSSRKKELYSLPDGNITSDVIVYVDAWDKLTMPLAEKFNVVILGYDPEVLIAKQLPDGSTSSPIRLPVWFVNEIVK